MERPKDAFGVLPRSHAENMIHVMATFEESYRILPHYWQSYDNPFLMDFNITEEQTRLMHTVFLYCISPIAFKLKYHDPELNEFASIAGFLPKDKEVFDPEEQDSNREEYCRKMVAIAYKFMLFMFNLLNEGRLSLIALRVFRFGKNTKLCLEESKKLCKDYFKGEIKETSHVALFTITLIVVSDSNLLNTIGERFKFLHDHTAEECRRYSEMAKDYVKKENYCAAISLYKQAIQFRPYDHFPYSNLAQIYLNMKKYPHAQCCAQRAIWIDHSWPKSHYRFIQALDCQGHLQEAWTLSSAIALMVESNACCFSGNFDLLEDLIKQKEYITAKVYNLHDFAMEFESTRNQKKKKRSKSKSNTAAIVPTVIAKQQKDLVTEKKVTPPLDDPKCCVPASKGTVKGNMPSVPDVTEVPSKINADSREYTKSVKNVAITENTPPQVLVNHNSNGKVGKGKCNAQNFNKYLQEGSEALIVSSYKVAYLKYSMALGVLQAVGKKALGLSELNIIVLKYCFAKACIGKGANEDISLGLKTLDEIINDHYTISFPLAYYGKASGYITQNRFKEAKEPLLSLSSIIKNKIKLNVYVFPKCESNIIEESHPEKLQELVKNMLSLCNAPPPPNAICRYVTDDASHRSEIYFSDFDFQGFAQIICRERCHLSYHMPCWKHIKEDRKLYLEKDFLGKPCFTPDCHSTISKIELFGADGVKRKSFPSEDEIKPKLKDGAQSKPPKETKKIGKPIFKKVPNQHPDHSNISEQATDRLELHRQSDSSAEEKLNDFAIEDTRQNAIMVLQKKVSEDSVPLTEKKKQSKKSKLKEVLPLDFAKSDDPRIEQLKTMKDAAEIDSFLFPPKHINLDPAQPFSLPPHVRGNIAETEKWLQESSLQKSWAKSSEFQGNYLGRFGSDSELNGVSSKDRFSKEPSPFSSNSGIRHKYSDDIELPWRHFPAKDKLKNILDSQLKKPASDSTLKDCSSGKEVTHELPRTSSYSCINHELLNYSSTKSTQEDIEDQSAVTIHPPTNPSMGSCSNFSELSESPTNNHDSENKDFDDGQSSVSELSNADENISDIAKKYFGNSLSGKFKRKVGDGDDRGSSDFTTTDEVCDSELKHGLSSTSLTQSTTVVNGVDTSFKNEYLKSEEKKSGKSQDAACNQEHCGSCLKYSTEIATLKERYSLATAQCQDVKGKLLQSLKELQATKKELGRENGYTKEELEEYFGGCASCLELTQEINILKENYMLTTSQCQDLKDRLVQAQNELQVTKKAAENDSSDMKEELKKYKKLCSSIQSTVNANIKKLEAEKRKLNADLKILTEKVESLNFDKDKFTVEKNQLEATLALRQTSLDEERKQRFKVEEDVKTIKRNLDAAEANCKRSLNNEDMLTEKVKVQDMQINSLLSELNHMRKLQLRMPPPVFPDMNQPPGRLGRPYIPIMMPDHYRMQYPMPEGFPPHMGGNGGPLLPTPSRPPRFDPRNNLLPQFPPTPDKSLSNSSSIEDNLESDPVSKAGPNLTQPPSRDQSTSVVSSLSFPQNLPSGSGTSQLLQLPSGIIHPPKVESPSLPSRSNEGLNIDHGLSSELQASGGRSSLLYSAAAAKESKLEGRNTSYNKLLQLLYMEFPTIEKSELSKYITKVRSKHNNRLSFLLLRDIVHEVRGTIFDDNTLKGAIPTGNNRRWPSSSAKGNQMGLDKFDEMPFSWGVPETRKNSKRYYSDKDECYICFEPMDEGDIDSLSCGHAYHSKCVKPWFEVNNTCPTCRLYAPLEEDYPLLG